MKKYFITSDTHSFFTLLKEELERQGWEQNNPDHILIEAGDLFDRGPESKELLEFVQDLGDRFIYIRGNHEDLLDQCVTQIVSKGEIGRHHISNGTLETIKQLTGVDCYDSFWGFYGREQDKIYYKMKPILNWIWDKSIDYLELNKYVITHGWIPTVVDETKYKIKYKYDPEWRNATKIDWDKARWLNGMECWKQGVVEPGKSIICGHWNCSYYWSHIKQRYPEYPDRNKKDFDKSFQPAIDSGLVALDACTAYSKKVNVFIVEE